MFTQSVIEKLGYYVYFLLDPRDNKIFYVGKGIGNRVFQHLACAQDLNIENAKFDTIRDIIQSGNPVHHYILRHGLTEEVAFEIEASIIDFVGIDNLSNKVNGHYSDDYGIKTTDEITAMYNAEELSTNEPIILININRLYRRDMTEQELYDSTRKSWVMGERRRKAKYAIATYRGLTREVYEIADWFPSIVDGKTRWGFNGTKASAEIQKTLRYKSIAGFIKQGAANPIKYINC